MTRSIRLATQGQGHGPITRLMSPGDLGELLKPFVFLDIFSFSMLPGAGTGMPLHPHSGIATVTVFTEGEARFEDPIAGKGTLGYGGVEWARAGKGMWHGQELSGGNAPRTQGFQLWLALPPELELSPSESQYVESEGMPTVGPARLIVGEHGGAASPVRSPEGINYLLVTLGPGERWTYTPPAGHRRLWLALARGDLQGDRRLRRGALVIFEDGEEALTLEGGTAEGATFVLGSAIPHPQPLHLGRYSVHSSAEALAIGERHIVALKRQLDAAGDRRNSSGATPIFRG